MRIFIYFLFLCAAPAVGFGQKSITPMDLSSETCSDLYDKGSGYGLDGMYQKEYDTLKKFVELCANVKVLTGKGEIGFLGLDGATQYRNSDPNRFIEYRDWLKTVLYLNLDTIYYCSAVRSIWYTFNYNPPLDRDYRAMMAILKYTHDSGKCNLAFSNFDEIYGNLRELDYELWVDTVMDSIATPYDTTTLPTIDDLDMSILRGPQNSVSPIAGETQRRLSFVTAERNPFTDEVALKVELNSSTLLRLDIFDELGRSVYGEGLGYKQKGDHRFSVDGKNWSSGAYFARISTSSGEVRTIKMIKQ